jgi:hypothetical protein
MGNESSGERGVSERRELVRWLRAHGDVSTVEFTRDGFRTVFVEMTAEVGLDRELRRRAEELGYTVLPPDDDARERWTLEEWWSGDHEAVYVLALGTD